MKPLVRCRRSIKALRSSSSALSSAFDSELRSCVFDVVDMVRDSFSQLGFSMEGVQIAREEFRRDAEERRRVLDKVMTAKGRIRVMARVRPVEEEEESCLKVGGGSIAVGGSGEYEYRNVRRKFK
jgi:hypothetical protein